MEAKSLKDLLRGSLPSLREDAHRPMTGGLDCGVMKQHMGELNWRTWQHFNPPYPRLSLGARLSNDGVGWSLSAAQRVSELL